MKYNSFVKVDFYEISVNYSGSFEQYSIKDWEEKALAKWENGVDPWQKTENIELKKAREIDGVFSVENEFPCNKIALVKWAYIDEETLFKS